jgi:hypothetical protein
VVQWFSGMLFYVVGVANSHTNSVVFKIEKGGELQQVEGWEEVWFGKRFKRREGVTRLIELFYQSNSRIYKLKCFFFF